MKNIHLLYIEAFEFLARFDNGLLIMEFTFIP